MPNVQVYDASRAMRSKLPQLVADGVTLLCPKCKSELIIVLDADAVREHQMHPGVYCSKTLEHFFEMYEYRRNSSNGMGEKTYR